MSTVEQAHAAIVHAKNKFQKHVNDVGRHRDQYSPDGFRAQVTGFASSDAAAAVDAAVSHVRKRADEAAAHVDELRCDLSSHGDAAAEMRAGRYWSKDAAHPRQQRQRQGLRCRAEPHHQSRLRRAWRAYWLIL